MKKIPDLIMIIFYGFANAANYTLNIVTFIYKYKIIYNKNLQHLKCTIILLLSDRATYRGIKSMIIHLKSDDDIIYNHN